MDRRIVTRPKEVRSIWLLIDGGKNERKQEISREREREKKNRER